MSEIYYSPKRDSIILLIEDRIQLGGYCVEDDASTKLLPYDLKLGYLEYHGFEYIGAL